MQLVQFRDEVFQYYKTKVKGNEDISLLEAEKKMARNIQLAHKPDSTGGNQSCQTTISLYY